MTGCPGAHDGSALADVAVVAGVLRCGLWDEAYLGFTAGWSRLFKSAVSLLFVQMRRACSREGGAEEYQRVTRGCCEIVTNLGNPPEGAAVEAA